MDASGADKLILLVQTNQVLYDKSAAEYKVKDALEKGDIWQISVDIAVISERTTDLRCRFSFLVSRWRCDRFVRFLVSRFSFLVSRFSFLGGGVTGPLASPYVYLVNYKPCPSGSHLTYLGPRLEYCNSSLIHEVQLPIIQRTYIQYISYTVS